MEARKLLISYVYPRGFAGRAFFIINGLVGQATIVELEERIKQDLIADGLMPADGTLVALSYQILESAE